MCYHTDRDNVSYILDYYPQNRFPDEVIGVELAHQRQLIWDFKNGENTAIDYFYPLISEAISVIASRSDMQRFVLLTIPRSQGWKTNSMDHVIERFLNGDDNVATRARRCKQVLIHNNIIVRTQDSDSSHTGFRQSYNDLMAIHKCIDVAYDSRNTAYILMDDIKTTGLHMDVCSELICNAGIARIENIYGLVLARTVDL